MAPLTKLPTVLPQLVGKTVARTMLVIHPDSRSQLWLFFTDQTSYEFYADAEIGGARRPTGTTVEEVFREEAPISTLTTLLTALHFAAEKHRTQRRKDPAKTPYINHPIEVATILAECGVTDLTTLVSALLHDTIEDTDTTPQELRRRFGAVVRDVVLEVTDDKSLPKAERKRLQVEHAPFLSRRARLVKLGDKISNIGYVADAPPPSWSLQRRREYLDWTAAVIGGCRGVSARLERRYDRVLREARKKLG